MAAHINWVEVLDLFCWGYETLSRPSVARALRGYDADLYRTLGPRFWRRLEQEQWLTKRGRGREAQFTITPKGRDRCAVADPRSSWNPPWDRRWRLVTFDVPEARSTDRVVLWRELRKRNLGLLQRSVWIWPRPLEPILHQVIQASGVPEAFAGFECARVFLCTDQEIVRAAWDFDGIHRAQDRYLRQAASLGADLRGATSLHELARAARQERLAYEEAMAHDPLLPRELWPANYLGGRASARHEEARAELIRRMTVVLAAECGSAL